MEERQDEQRMNCRIIDIHTHIYPVALARRAMEVTGHENDDFKKLPIRENLLARMREAGVDLSVNLPVVSKPQNQGEVNRFAKEAARKNIISFGGLHPDCENVIEELEKLTALLQAWQSDRRSDVRFQTFRSGGQLLDAARAERFTLYLLDVLMPGMTGMDAAREIRSFDAAADIIFLTTSPGFAYESYGVRAAEYLLKPINAKLLYPVLDKLYLRDQKPQDGLTVKSNGMLVRLPFSQLSYVEVNGKHLFFNMADGTVYEVAASMREYEGALLARPEFMRVHRSYLVNMLQAEKLSPAGVITFSGHNVPVSRLLYGQLQKDYLALLFSGRDA